MNADGVQSDKKDMSGLELVMAKLYAQSRGEEWGVEPAEFATILNEIGAKYFPEASPDDREGLYASLRVEELVLAHACAAGSDRAWAGFLQRYRQKIYDMAYSIAREESAGRDLADSIYADLYGTETRQGKRISKLASYSGRGSLEGWLRTVLAQEYINRYRKQRRTVSLDEESEEGAQYPAQPAQPVQTPDPRLAAATDAALAELAAEERFLLASYYLDGRTLAEIAHVLQIHESTVSRKLDKVIKSLRKQIVRALLQSGMSRRQAEEAMQADVRDLGLNVRPLLAQLAAQKETDSPFSQQGTTAAKNLEALPSERPSAAPTE